MEPGKLRKNACCQAGFRFPEAGFSSGSDRGEKHGGFCRAKARRPVHPVPGSAWGKKTAPKGYKPSRMSDTGKDDGHFSRDDGRFFRDDGYFSFHVGQFLFYLEPKI